LRRVAAIGFLLMLCGGALAAEPEACGKFTWPLEAERALLSAAEAAASPSVEFDRNSGKAFIVPLVPFNEAQLAMPPERAPRNPDSFAGAVRFAAAPAGGTYNVTLAANAWVDIVQDGRLLKSLTFTGGEGCDGVRKSVRFAIGAGPFILQLSDVAADSIRAVLTPAK
jgi:hypothetical protein